MTNTKNKRLLLLIVGITLLAFMAIVFRGLMIYNDANLKIKNLSSENTDLENILFERDSIVNEMVGAFDIIENNLTFINKRRNQLMFEDRETRASQKDIIIRDIRMMDKMLVENSKKMEELEKKLHDSGIQLKSLKNKIASLNKSIDQQNSQIAELRLYIEDQNTELAIVNQQNDELQDKVLAFKDTINFKDEIIDQKEAIIMQQINSLNTGYFASGTYRELFEKGVVSKEGGFLGIGKNKILHNNLNESYFTQVDITQNRIIPLNARKINMISEHPENSYKIIEENGLITNLEIEIPEDFWKISHYAVIEVKM